MAAPDTGLGMRRLHDALQQEQAGDVDAALRSGEEALEAFGESGDRTGQAAAHQLLAGLRAAAGQHREALAHVEAAIPLREQTGDAQGLASLHQGRFELALALERPELRARAAEDLIHLLRQAADRDGEARARHQLAEILLDAGEPWPAQEQVLAALAVSDAPGEERARAAVTLLSARLAFAQGDRQRAVQEAQEGLRLARLTERQPIIVDALDQVAELLLRLDRLAEARDALDEAQAARANMKDLGGRARALRRLAQVEQAMGRPAAALTRFSHAASCLAELGEPEEQLEVLHAAAELAMETGRLPEALELSAAQVQVAEAHGDPGLIAAAWHVRASRRVSAGDLQGAAEAFSRAAEARAQAAQPEAEGVALAMLGQVLGALGQEREARAALQRSLSALRAAGSEAAAEVEALLAGLG